MNCLIATYGIVFFGLMSVVPTAMAQRAREDGLRGVAGTQYAIEMVGKIHEAIVEEMQLDDRQLETIDDIFADYTAMLKEELDRLKQNEEENAEELAVIKERLADARDRKDWNEYRAIKEQLKEMTEGSNETARLLHDLQEELKEVFDEAQQEEVQKIVARFSKPQEDPYRVQMRKMMVLLKAVGDIELYEDQEAEIQVIRKEMLTGLRDAGRSDADQLQKQYDQYRKRITDLLEADQQTAFEEAEEKATAELAEGPEPRHARGQQSIRQSGEFRGRSVDEAEEDESSDEDS